MVCSYLFSPLVLCLEFEELSRLLKGKGIDVNNPGRVLDPLEVKKAKLLARDEDLSRKRTERPVLTKAMSDHAIPRLFVSRRNDKGPNGFNCSICKKDVSFLSRVHEESGGTSSVRVITSKIVGTVTTMRM